MQSRAISCNLVQSPSKAFALRRLRASEERGPRRRRIARPKKWRRPAQAMERARASVARPGESGDWMLINACIVLTASCMCGFVCAGALLVSAYTVRGNTYLPTYL